MLDPNRPAPQVSNILSELDRARATTLTLGRSTSLPKCTEGFLEDVESTV
jgi:hypothetical protein